jgi:hypothetical protein
MRRDGNLRWESQCPKQKGNQSRSDNTKQHITPGLRCFPVHVGHFPTGGVVNETAVAVAQVKD